MAKKDKDMKKIEDNLQKIVVSFDNLLYAYSTYKKLYDSVNTAYADLGKRFDHAIALLKRIKDCYPSVFKECVTKDDIQKLMSGYNEDNK